MCSGLGGGVSPSILPRIVREAVENGLTDSATGYVRASPDQLGLTY